MMKKILPVVFMCLCIAAPVFALDGNEMLKKSRPASESGKF